MERLAEGTQFGSYTIEGVIAGGGMGQVYAASHTVYGNAVALKVLHERLHADEDWRARFNEEGLVGTQLKHPYLLSARELVEADGRVALVMDLVSGGQTLEKIITREFRTGLPVAAALPVFLKVLQGIEYLHEKGIVHGDLKPENVMIEGDFRKPETWNPKVTDFGTVALIANPVLLDGRPAVVATPRYASPEHLLGVDQVEERSDIYCLGLLLHFLLTSEHISNAQTVREAAEKVLRPVSPTKLVDQPEILLHVFGRATQVDPTQRFQTTRELALSVREVLDSVGFELESHDVSADLATEVDEERAQLKAAAAARAGGAEEDEIPTAMATPGPVVQREGTPPPIDNRRPEMPTVPPVSTLSSNAETLTDLPPSGAKADPSAETIIHDKPPGSERVPPLVWVAGTVALMLLLVIVYMASAG